MKDVVIWIVTDPLHYALCVGSLTFVLGVMVGRTTKTNKIEIELRQTKRELSAVLHTIELKKRAVIDVGQVR